VSELSKFFRTRTGLYTAFGLGIVGFVLVVVTPVTAAFWAQNGDIDDMLQQLGSYRAEIAAQPALQAQLAELDRQGATVPGVIEGDTTSLAEAQLQRQIKTLVEENQGTLHSVQTMPAIKQGGFETIAVQADLSVPISRLKALAYALSAHRPYLFVDEASITTPPSDPDNIQAHEQMLDVRWTVHGYRWVAQK
jgi:predicted secreted protein